MLKLGIIGSDINADNKIKVLNSSGLFQISGLYDYNSPAIESTCNMLNISSAKNYDSVLENCDAVYFPSFINGYYAIAVEALKKSRHIFIDNPASISPECAANLIKLAKEANRKVQVIFPERYNPAFTAAKKYFHGPLFIETHRLAQFNQKNASLPVVFELMIHDIDIVLNSIKSNVKKISASGVAIVSNTFDIANARLEFDNGCVANLTASRISMHEMTKTRIFQNDSYLTIDFSKKSVNVLRVSESNDLAQKENTYKIGEKELYFEKPNTCESNIFHEALKSFHCSITSDSDSNSGIIESYNTLLTAEKIIEKMKLTSNCL